MATQPRILLLDDDPALLDFLRFAISAHIPSAHVTAIGTGYDLLLAYQQHGADLIILDHRLPDVLGSALLQYLRETGVTTPTIVMSGVLTHDMAPIAPRTYFLPKPLGLTEFIATITNALAHTGKLTAAA